MYDESRDSANLETTVHNINLRSSGKVKMKSNFLGLTKLHQLPEIIQSS